MKKDKITLKADLQKNFNDASLNEIKIAIIISQIMKFLHKEPTCFVLTLLPTLITAFFITYFGGLEKALPFFVVGIILHPILFFFFFKKTLFKSFPDELEYFNSTVDILEEIKNKKTSK